MGLGSIAEAVVACEDVERTVSVHAAAFGWDVLARDETSVLMGVKGIDVGHVRFEAAGPAKAAPAPATWELGLRMLSIYTRDVHKTAAAVARVGGRTGDVVEWEPVAGCVFHECLGFGPDDLIWCFPNPARTYPTPALERDADRVHGELHNVVLNVSDMDAALAFFEQAGGMKLLVDSARLDHPEMLTLMGMPEGSVSFSSFLSGEDERPARLELLSYENVPGGHLRRRALGVTRLCFLVEDPAAVGDRLVGAGAVRVEANLLLGPEQIEIELRSSAG